MFARKRCWNSEDTKALCGNGLVAEVTAAPTRGTYVITPPAHCACECGSSSLDLSIRRPVGMQTLRKTISLLCFVVLLLTNVTAVPEYVELSRGIRLRDGHSEGVGRVEVLHAGEWGTVCNEGWDMVDAYVACRQLGFPGVLNSYTAIDGVGPVWLARVACKGTESAVSQCRHSPWGRTQCLRRNDVGVSCRRGTDPNYLEEVDECGPYPQVHNFAVRLVGKRPYRGKVEVRVGELWQPICADQWGGKDAMVLCGQLGYSRGYAKVHAQKSTLQLQGVSTSQCMVVRV